MICKPILHRPQHLWNERAGAERVARPRSPCAIQLLCSTTAFQRLVLFLFLLRTPFEFLFHFIIFPSHKLLEMEMAQAMTKPLFDGWEKRTTPSGLTCCFIDHKSRHWVISFVFCNSNSSSSSFLFVADPHFEQDSSVIFFHSCCTRSL